MQVSPLEMEVVAQRQPGTTIQMIGMELVNMQPNRRSLKLSDI